jgi:hypothetical protein
LANKFDVTVTQAVVEVWLTEKAFLRQRNFGIQDQRARRGAASVVAFAGILLFEIIVPSCLEMRNMRRKVYTFVTRS